MRGLTSVDHVLFHLLLVWAIRCADGHRRCLSASQLRIAICAYDLTYCGLSFILAFGRKGGGAVQALNLTPTDEEINQTMSAVLCHGGTYNRIRRSIHRAAEG